MTNPIPGVASKGVNISIRRKPVTRTTSETTKATVKNAAQPRCSKISTITSDERHHLIELASYYFAVKEKFEGTFSRRHWLQAEREIDAMIASGKFAG